MAVCASCGAKNAEGQRYCGSCTAPLATSGERLRERKTVTVVFCDVVGSTTLGESHDPEAVERLLISYFVRMREIVEAHGGTVEKFIGDAVVAVFGVPVAHEDDALRALRAAVEMRGALPGLGVEGRIGVDSGEIVTSGLGTLVTGDAVNVAARLEQAASPGEILVGAPTLALAGGSAVVEELRPLALKGKAEPVPAFRLLGVGPVSERRRSDRFVGRVEEMALLRGVWERALVEERCLLATVVGEPGIGKSRLVEELIAGLGARAVRGRCLSYGEGITYFPVVEVIKQLGDLPEDPAGAGALRALLGESEAATTSDEIAWAFRKLLEQAGPLVVVFDDIQWGEETFLDLVEHVALLAAAPLLLLCIARPELSERRPQWPIMLRVGPLQPVEVDELLPGFVLPSLRTRIVRAAGGNPLFLTEMVAVAADGGDEVVVPPTLRALLAARLDRLDGAERSVLQRGAVEGELFHRGAVQALGPPETELNPRLTALVRKELIRPDRPIFPTDDGFRFCHLLIRDAAYDALPKATRAELHERFADWLERHSDGLVERDEIIGYHLEQAYQYRLELAPEDDHALELALRSGRLLERAGRQAHANDDAPAARSLLARATELLRPDDPARPALLVLLGDTAFVQGDVPRAMAFLEEARAAAAAAGQRGVELRARVRRTSFLLQSASTDVTTVALDEAYAAIDELTELDDPESLGFAWYLVAAVGNARGDFVLKEQAASRWLECARRARLPTQTSFAAAVLISALEQGPTHTDEAIARAEQVLADFPGERRPGESSLGLLYAYAGRFGEAEAAITHSRRIQLELGRPLIYASMSMAIGWSALLAGEPARAEAPLQEGAELLEAAGERGWMSTVAAILAEVLYKLERDDDAEAWSRRSERATSPEDSVSQALWRATRAKALARRDGDAAKALRLSKESVEQARIGNNLRVLGECLSSRAAVFRLLGRADESGPLLEEALTTYELKGIIPAAERVRALLSGTPARSRGQDA
jgi:class 3 adenylate cyclase/tetratricopeptide (TPR) repeat protein